MNRSLGAIGAVLAIAVAPVIAAPAAQAASTSVVVDCTSVTPLTDTIGVGPSDTVVFDVSSCVGVFEVALTTAYSAGLTGGHLNVDGLNFIVGRVANLSGTGGSTVSSVTYPTASVTYTAGSGFGTDTLIISNTLDGRRGLLSRALHPRTGFGRQSFSMVHARAGVAAPPPPTTYTLQLAGTETSQPLCWNTQLSGHDTTTVTLPPAAQCTRVGSNAPAGSILLGWATDPTFPIATAQKHVDLGWGTFDGPVDGVRMVFIPAGKDAVLSGNNTLYAIWDR